MIGRLGTGNTTLIKGCKGDTGPKGDKGDTGQQGVIGQQGVQGPQGIQGLKGDKGDQGEKGDTGPLAISDFFYLQKNDVYIEHTNDNPQSIPLANTTVHNSSNYNLSQNKITANKKGFYKISLMGSIKETTTHHDNITIDCLIGDNSVSSVRLHVNDTFHFFGLEVIHNIEDSTDSISFQLENNHSSNRDFHIHAMSVSIMFLGDNS